MRWLVWATLGLVAGGVAACVETSLKHRKKKDDR